MSDQIKIKSGSVKVRSINFWSRCGHVTSGLVKAKSGQVRTCQGQGQVRIGQCQFYVISGQFKSKGGQVQPGQFKKGYIRSGQVRSRSWQGQVRTSLIPGQEKGTLRHVRSVQVQIRTGEIKLG